MSMFSKSRMDMLEDNQIRQLEREERTFRIIMDSLDQIKKDLHEISSKVISSQSELDMKIVTTRESILQHINDSSVSKDDLQHELNDIHKQIENIKSELSDKVSKNTIKVIWATLSTFVGIAIWILTNTKILG